MRYMCGKDLEPHCKGLILEWTSCSKSCKSGCYRDRLNLKGLDSCVGLHVGELLRGSLTVANSLRPPVAYKQLILRMLHSNYSLYVESRRNGR